MNLNKKFMKEKKNNQKGFILSSTYMLAVAMIVVAGIAYTNAISESKRVDWELSRVQSYYAAEAGLQSALAQIGTNAYTGFINTNAIAITNFQAVDGTTVGAYHGATKNNINVTINYPNEADWVIVNVSSAIKGAYNSITNRDDDVTCNLEGRVFLDSNLSKYMIYINITNLYVGNNAKFGYSDGVNPQGVPSNSAERMAMYYTGNWVVQGTNVDVYGDMHAQLEIDGNSSTLIHGDAYAGNFATNASGQVTNDGITGGVVTNDGFSDDTDRNGDGAINSTDAPDIHDLTAAGGGDAHKTETLTAIDHSFYQTNNNIPSFGTGTQNRYLEFQENGDHTRVVEYSNANFTTQTATHELPPNAIVYVNGDAYVKGQIKGRVALVTSDDIYVDGDTTYAGGSPYSADTSHSAAFLAKDKVFFRPDNLKISGIVYGENTSGSSNPIDASYNLAGNQVSSKTQLRTYGNLITNGQPNTSIYQDRTFGYDKNLKKYRPPGIPVQPLLRTVREE